MSTDLVEIDGVGRVSPIFVERRNEFFAACTDPKTNPEVRLQAARRWYDSVDVATKSEMSEFCRQIDKQTDQFSRANQSKS